MVSEDWKTKEPEKVMLSRKYQNVSNMIGLAFANPTEQNAKAAYGATVEFITSIPIGERKDVQAKRDKFKKDLRKIGVALYGNRKDPLVLKAIEDIGATLVSERDMIYGYKKTLGNIPLILEKIQDILIKASDFTVSCGLRISLSERKTTGMNKLDEEEGYEG